MSVEAAHEDLMSQMFDGAPGAIERRHRATITTNLLR
jgi:hypothetical protein